MNHQRYTIVGIGEALFDIIAGEPRLGGAPLNVAVHAHQLGRQCVNGGAAGVVASRVGQDRLGEQVISELRQREMPTDYIQTDPDNPTGRVYVDIDAQGQPSFDIQKNVAWDWLQFDPDMEPLARSCDAICFGSLAQRNGQARNTIYRFVETGRRAIRLFDVNIRRPFFDRQHLIRSGELSSIMKLNLDELPRVCDAAGLIDITGEGRTLIDRQATELRKRFELDMVVLTRGSEGTILYGKDDVAEGEAVSYPATDGADSVGAGDAVSAAVIIGLLQRKSLAQIADFANRIGAYVASQPGATTAMPEEVAKW